MNRLQLATLLSWAGETGIQGRKRLQKLVFFLQHAGCPLDCRFTLHHFGPYSRDVADRCDEMVAAGLINETGGQFNGNTQYAYALKPATQTALAQIHDDSMNPFKSLGESLIFEHLWLLELGSTILFYYGQNPDWNVAMQGACEFKKVPADAKISRSALALAQRVQQSGNQ